MGLLDRAADRFRRVFAPPLITPTPSPTSAVRDIVDNPNDLPTSGYGGFGEWGGTQLLFNAITAFGTPNDPSWMNRWLPQRMLRRKELFALGRNALSFRAINLLGATATSEGWGVVIEDERITDKNALAKQVADYERRLAVPAKSARAIARGRQYGDAIVLLGIDDSVDGQIDFAKPVDPHGIRTIRWAVVIDRRDFEYHSLYGKDSEHFGEVESYQITDINGILEDGVRYGPASISYAGEDLSSALQRSAGQLIVHASRVLSFRTVDGFSTLDTLQDSLAAYIEAAGGIRTAAREASIVKYKIGQLIKKGWNENAGRAYSHMSLVDRAKNMYNAWVLDKDNEDVEMLNRNLAGVSDLTSPFMVWLAAALGIPVTVFWGVSPGGFGKGEAERDTWHESVYAFQTTTLEPQLTKLHGYILAAWDGPRLSPDIQRRIEFADLSPPDETQRSELRSKAISDLVRLKEADIIDRDEVRDSLPRDEFFAPVLSKKQATSLGPMAVGAITGSVAIMQAVYPTGVPIAAARALQRQVDPLRFTPDVVAEMYPDPDPATTPAAPDASSNVPASNVEPDTEDNESEDESTEGLAYSTDPIPTDAMEAADLAELFGLKRKQAGRITRAAREGKFRVWRFFGGKPRFSRAEVEAAWRRDNNLDNVPDETAGETETEAAAVTDAQPVRDWNADSLCVVIRCPDNVAVQCPYKPHDTSPPHITLAYVDGCPPEKLGDVIASLVNAFALLDPFEVTLGSLEYFTVDFGGEHRRVAYAGANFSVDARLYRQEIVDAINEAGLAVREYTNTTEFTPHVTLAYVDDLESYAGPVPRGSWRVDALEIWHGADRIAFALDGAAHDDYQARRQSKQATRRVLERVLAGPVAPLSGVAGEPENEP